MVLVPLLALLLVLAPLVIAGVSGPGDREPSRPPAARATALPACTIIGTQASETLVGTAGDDVICALGGDDVVRGRGGDDVLFGSFGDDVLEGGPGRDELKGHWGADRLNGGGGNDRLHGGGDGDVFSGGDGADIVDYVTRTGPVRVSIGSGGADDGWVGEHDRVRGDVESVRGGAGADRLVGNGRRNRLYGRGGNDFLKGGKGDDSLWGGRGADRLDGRDKGSFKDALDCGPGRPDAALANARDRVADNCEDVTQPRPPPGDKNRAPTDLSLSNSSVAENRPAGTVVGTLSAEDRDARDEHRFKLVRGSGDDDNAAFAIVGDELRTAAVFDFETKPSASLRVRVTDGNGGAFEKALRVTVTDVAETVNSAPTDVSLAPAAVAENAPSGTTVGTLSAADLDGGQSHTFALVAGAGDADNGAFAVAGDQLRTAQTFDFESRPSYSIRVATTDAAGATFAKALTVSVVNVNEAPTALTLSQDEVAEGEPAGTAVGTLAASDPDVGQGHGFTLVTGAGDADNDSFTIDDSTLKTAEVFDFEAKDSYSIRVRATDDGSPAQSLERELTVTVTDDNESPAADATTVTLDEDDGPVTIDLAGSDANGQPLTFAVVSSPQHGDLDTTSPAATCDGATPSSCTASVAYTPDADFNGTDSFSYRVDDGTDSSPPASVSISVGPVNDAPAAGPASVSVNEDGSVPVDLAALVSDMETADGDLAYEIVSGPADGALTGAGGSRTYTPDDDFNSSDSFTYRVTDRGDPDDCSAPAPCDGPETSTTQTVSLTVAPVNHPPVATPETVSVNEDGTVPIDLATLVSDAETSDANLTYTIVTPPAHGTFAGGVYTPAGDFNGADGFTYNVTDRGDPDNCASPPCDDALTSTTETVAITVDPVNDAPVATPTSLNTNEDTALPVDLRPLVTDVETADADLTFEIVTPPSHGDLTGGTYTPDTDYNGPDSFEYKVTDRGDPDGCSAAPCDGPESATATVSIAVGAVNDAPVADAKATSTAEELSKSITLSGSDTEGDPLTFDVTSDPQHGTVTGTGASRLYTPAPNYNGSDSFEYVANDGTADSAPATVTITVDPVNDAPVATPTSLNTNEDTALPVDLTALVGDVETAVGDLTYEIVDPPAHGDLTGGTYTPAANFNGPDAFTYRVTDRGDPDDCSAAPCDAPETSTIETVTIAVAPVNDTPTAADTSLTTDEDTSRAVDLLPLVSDLETADADLLYEIVDAPSHGDVTGSGGSRTYTPDADFNGLDTFSYRVADRGDPDNCSAAPCDGPEISDTKTVSITVDPVNDAPVNTLPAGPLTATQNTDTPVAGILIADVDAGGDDVQVLLSVGHGTLTLDPTVLGGIGTLDVAGNGTSSVAIVATLAQINTTLASANGLAYHGDAPYTGPDVLAVDTSDAGHNGAGGAQADGDTLAINVVPPNAAPVAAAQSVSTNEDTAKTITLSASDADGDDPLTFAKGTGPSHGSLGAIGTVTCDHATPNVCTATVTYAPDSDYFGPDSFTYTADDGTADSAPATVSITVDPLNDPPKLQDTEGGALAYTENDPPTVITATTTVADDSPDLDTGTLTVDYTSPGTADDRLEIRNQGTGLGEIGVSGTTVTFGGVAIGTFTGGTGTTALAVTLNEAATPSAAQALIRNVTYRNISDAPSTAPRTARFLLTDGDGGTSAPATRAIAVTVVNDSPALAALEPGALGYTENDPPTALTSGLTVTDPDSTNLASATVQITGNYQSGADVLAAASQFGVTPSFDPDTGTLTLTGSTSLANYQTLLRSVTYANTSDAPSALPRTVSFKVGDGAAESAAATRGITVTAVDDAQTVTTSGGSTAYTEQDPAAIVDGGLVLADPDGGADPTAATVKIVSPAAGDGLVFSDQNGITGSFASGTLTLSGAATQAQYQAALRSVRFTNLTNDAPGASRSIEFQLTAPTASNTATKSIAITQVNDAPSSDPTGSAGSALEQTATAVDAGIVVSDPDSANLKGATVQITSNFQSGQDTLQFTDQNGITGDVSGSQLTLTGSATAAQYETALRSVTYTNTSDTPNTATRTITFGVSDDETPSLQSAPQTRDLAVVPVNDAPTDAGESQNATGNTQLEVELTGGGSTLPKRTSATGNLLDNAADVDDAASALSVDTATVSDPPNGTVSVNADGSFVYTPDVGYTGADSFTYKVKDDENAQSATSTVSITVANRVWYVKNDFAGTADGRSETPFTTLAAADNAADATGDTIYVLRGAGTTGLADTVDLLANQRLLGQAVNLVVGGTTLFTGTPANRPPLSGTVNVDDANTISGVAIAGSGAPAIAGTTGDASGTITDVTLSGPAGGLDLNGTSGTWDISDLTVNTSGGTAVNLTNAGTVNFTPAGTISLSSTAGPALVGTATTALSGTIDSVTTTSSATTGISLTGTTGSLTLDDVNLTTTGTALSLNNANNVTVNSSGDADVTSSGTAINLTNGPTTQPNAPDVALDQVTSSGGTVGINIDGIGAGTFSAAGGTLSGHSAAELDINGGSGNITYPGTIGNGSGLSAQFTGRSGGTVALAGNVNDSTDAGGGIDMSTNSGGTFNFSGTTKTLNTGTGAAFSSTGSSPTINLTNGGLDIDTAGGAGLSASGGGTLNVTTGTNPNTIDTTTGTALNVTSTSIGSSGLTFRSIASNGAASGIVLNSTGSSGGLTVAGNGGTCSSAATCTGGAIQSSSGPGINLTSVGGGANLTRMSVNSGGDDGIRGTTVNGLTLSNSRVISNGNAVGERGIDMFDLTGSGGIASSTISGSSETNVRIENNTATALTAFNVTASTISSTSTVTGDDGLLVLNDGAGAMSVRVTGSTFTDNKGDQFQAASDADASGSMNVVFDNNTLDTTLNGPSGGSPAIIGGGITINTSGTLDINFHVANNTIQRAFDDAINLNLDPGSQAGANFVGTVTGNTIGTTGVLDSGSESSNTVTFAAKGAGTATVAITNNNVRQFSNAYGIFVGATEGSPVVNATVTGNTVKEPGTFALNGIRVDAGATAGPPADASTVCVALTGNNATGSAKAPPSDTDIRLRQRFGTTIRLPGYSGANNDSAAVNTFVSNNNNLTGAPTVSSVFNVPGGGGFTGGAAACTLPPP